jgi:hypothetical protein
MNIRNRSTADRARARLASCALALATISNLAVGGSANAAGIEVKATPETTTTTPLLGYNFSSLIRPETLAWLERSGGTSTRFRTSAACIESYPSSPESISRWRFIQRRHEIMDDLLARPADFDSGLAQRHADWGAIRSAYQSGGCGDLELALDAFDAMGQKPLILIDSKSGPINAALQGPPSDPNQPTGEYWFQRWWVWRHYFIQAYYHGRVHGTVNYEFVNEPDHNGDLTVDETIERQVLAGDAIQRGIDAVNRWRQTQSLPPLQAFVNTSATGASFGSFAQAIVAERVLTDFYSYSPSTAWAFPTSFNAYSYHQYLNNSPLSVTSGINNSRAGLTAATGSSTFPMSLTEVNLRFGRDTDDHNWTELTQDSVRNAINTALMMGEITRSSLKGAYVFKFGDTLHATHWLANGHVGGTKRAGDVIKLYNDAFAGGLTRMQFDETSDGANFAFTVAHDPAHQVFYVLSVNHHCDTLPAGATDLTQPVCDAGEADNHTLTIDMDAWGVPPNTQVIAEEVSQQRRGEVRRFYTVDAARRVQILGQPAQSAVLVTIPYNSSSTVEQIAATADGYVRAGDHRAGTFGTHTKLYAYANTIDANERRAAYLKFALPADLDPDDIALAVLRVTARSGPTETEGSGTAVAQVYGVDDDSWTESDLRWNTAPGLMRSTATLGDITTIDQNPLWDIGNTVHPIGALTTNSEGPTTERINVTDYVRSQSNGVSSFAIVREIRFPGDTSPTNARIWMAAREHATSSYRPVLEIVRRCGPLSC